MKYLSVVLLAVLLLTACSDDSTGPDTPVPLRSLTEGEHEVLKANNDFAFSLFESTVATAPEKNVFLSPLSVSMALGMTLNGAVGETRTAMEETMALHGLTSAEINGAWKGLSDLLMQADPRVILTIANSIWSREGFSVEQSFIDTNREFFDAEVQSLDFNDPQAAATINAWVNAKTNGLIPDIIDPPIPPEMMMYLINAVYFKGSWTTQFDPSKTLDDEFTALGGTKQPIKMMQRKGDIRYFANTMMQVVDLPYGWDRFSMAVVLPRPGVSLTEAAAELTSRWEDLDEQLGEIEMTVQLPRFTLEYEVEFSDILSALGMEIAFDPSRADFAGINANGGLFISEVRHKTFVEVNEEGTEAAAVTSVGVGTTSVPEHMRVDRPFLFVIHERHSGAILFIGQVTDLGS
ncbi:MAG: hypothetical protein C0600_00035 [Ignavibacteria bacterium]|nr:MAG: hypothetical protein C0600_00035 [Ignavibacteria bacterium]